MKCLVTGASGFIGLKLCKVLKNDGWDVLALSRGVNKGPWHQCFKTDLLGELPNEAFAATDIVFHLAGKAHAVSETQQNEEYKKVNVTGTQNVLQKAREAGVRRFVFFSSVKTMCEENNSCLTEDTICRPVTPYGRSKLEAEQLVLHGDYVPEQVIIRLPMVYGPCCKGNLPKMINAVRKGLFPPFSEVGNKRSMVHVDDVVQAAVLAGKHPRAVGQTYIVTDGQAYTTRQIYVWICKAVGRSVPQWQVPNGALKVLAWIGDGIGYISGSRFIFNSSTLAKLTGSALYSSNKIQRELGFDAKNKLKDSLPEIVANIGC